MTSIRTSTRVAGAVFRRGLLSEVPNLHVLGVTHDEAVDFPHLGLEVWGRAHRDYGDMVPLETIRPRRTRWQIALAHGHYDRSSTAASSRVRPG